MTKLATLGTCYSPALTQGRSRIKSIFIEAYRQQNDHLRSRLLACTPKAWSILKNDKVLLRKLRRNIGPEGKERINQDTIDALNIKGIYIDFLSRDNKGYFALCLMEEKDSAAYKASFKEVEEPTNRNLRILEKTTGQKLNIYNLTVKQRKQLLAILSDLKIRFEHIEQVLLVDGNEFELLHSISGKITIAFGRNLDHSDTGGYINWPRK